MHINSCACKIFDCSLIFIYSFITSYTMRNKTELILSFIAVLGRKMHSKQRNI